MGLASMMPVTTPGAWTSSTTWFTTGAGAPPTAARMGELRRQLLYKRGAASAQNYALIAQYGGFPGTGNTISPTTSCPGSSATPNQTAGRTTGMKTAALRGKIPLRPTAHGSDAPFFVTRQSTRHTNAYHKQSPLRCAARNRKPIDDHDVRVIRETIDGTYTYTGTGPRRLARSPQLAD